MQELNEVQIAFGLQLGKACEAKGLSNTRLAKLTKISTSHIGAIKRGEMNVCLDTIRRCADACEVHRSVLLADWVG
jgi:transcriptional regulator with XRE-family HTH domain